MNATKCNAARNHHNMAALVAYFIWRGMKYHFHKFQTVLVRIFRSLYYSSISDCIVYTHAMRKSKPWISVNRFIDEFIGLRTHFHRLIKLKIQHLTEKFSYD